MDVELVSGLKGPKKEKWRAFLSRMGLEAVALATGIGWMFVVAFWTVFRKQDFKRMEKV